MAVVDEPVSAGKKRRVHMRRLVSGGIRRRQFRWRTAGGGHAKHSVATVPAEHDRAVAVPASRSADAGRVAQDLDRSPRRARLLQLALGEKRDGAAIWRPEEALCVSDSRETARLDGLQRANPDCTGPLSGRNKRDLPAIRRNRRRRIGHHARSDPHPQRSASSRRALRESARWQPAASRQERRGRRLHR